MKQRIDNLQLCKKVLFISSLAALASCSSNGDAPLVFVQAHSLGIVAAANGSQATPELTLGFRDVDVALVPVTAGGAPLKGVIEKPGEHYDDALSVFGQFNAGTAVGPTANLGKFFATGQAAKRLADGYAAQLGAKPK
jgi:hypothetical protein